MEALLAAIDDPDVRYFIEWGFYIGMRRGEIAKLDWPMVDRQGAAWVLRIPGAITKNKAGRSFGFDGAARAIIERRLEARRLDCPLVFHRYGRAFGPTSFRALWKGALKRAGLPPGLLFHDLRRSAVRNLIRSGVDPSVAMKVSGHKTRSMLDRYNIIEEHETAAALAKVDAWLATQPVERNVTQIAVGERSARSRGQLRANPPTAPPQATEQQGEDWCRTWDGHRRRAPACPASS